jgi:hypothetical protein
MNKNVFVAHLTRGVVATALAVSRRSGYASDQPSIPNIGIQHASGIRSLPLQTVGDSGTTAVTLRYPVEWNPQLEKEFRILARAEAVGKLSAYELARLGFLNKLRDRLRNPPSPDNILAQIRHDRLLDQMQKVLSEYVEFRETQDQKR